MRQRIPYTPSIVSEELPRLHTNSQTVSLSFESSLIQSCMRLDAPDELVLDYTKAMMGFLLFNPAPSRVLMIGLGGGSMLKYMHSHLPAADITVVEINQAVDPSVAFLEGRGTMRMANGNPYNNQYVFRFDVDLDSGKIKRAREYVNPVTFAVAMHQPLPDTAPAA